MSGLLCGLEKQKLYHRSDMEFDMMVVLNHQYVNRKEAFSILRKPLFD